MGDKVFMRIALYKHVMRFDKKDKLASRFVKSFEILDYIGKVVYWFVLLMRIYCTNNVFHVLLLHKYIIDLTHVLSVEDIEAEK